ncbi:MAG: hypothetical protein ABI743_10475 [bacterium]
MTLNPSALTTTRVALDERRQSAGVLAGAMTFSLALALTVPLASAVIALIVCGVWHNLAEFRFLARQGLGVLGERRVMLPLLTLFGGIGLVRLLAVLGIMGVGDSRHGEIALGYSTLAGLACWTVSPRRLMRWVLPLIGTAAWWSWNHPALHFVGLAQIHNIIPALLLIGWSRGGLLQRTGIHILWALVIPALLLTGCFDHWMVSDTHLGAAIAGHWTDFARGYVPASWLGTPMALRGLMLFAYLQLLHYFLWIIWIPRYSDQLTLPSTPTDVPLLSTITTRQGMIVGAVAAMVIGALMSTDFLLGRGLYASLASVHAYLEFPMLFMMVMQPTRNP